ncbi:MAG: tetratricopeptide repeat protein [Bacteroidota bacterium]
MLHLLSKRTLLFAILVLSIGTASTFAQNDKYERADFQRDSIYASKLAETIDSLYHEEQFDSCMLIIDKALVFFDKLDLSTYKIQVLTHRGAINRIKGRFSNAMADFSEVLDYYRQTGNTKGEAATLNQIGAIYRLRGDYPTALDYYFKSLANYQKVNHQPGISSVLNNIGVVHLYQKLYDKALEYYNKSLAIEENLKNDEGIGTSYLNIGEVYRKKGDLQKAADYYLRALVYANRTNDLDAIGTIYNELAGINIDNGSLNDVLKYLQLAHKTFLATSSPQRLAECEINFGKYYQKIGHLSQAIQHFSKALEIANSNKLLDIKSDAHHQLSQIYDMQGNIKAAYSHFKNYIATRDTLFNEENTRKSIQAEFFYKFEHQQEEQRIAQAKKDAEYAERLRREKAVKTSLIVIVSLGTILIGFILFYLHKIKLKNEELYFHQKEILEKNEELQQQQEEILAQRDEIERKNLILEQSQQIIADKNERMISSIEYAKTIQNALLPKPEKLSELFPDHFVIFQPKDIVSGDFYWVSNDERYTYAAVMDCTGHGVPGAFMSMIGNTLLNKIVIEWKVYQPSKVLEALNEQLREALKQKEIGNIVLAGIDIAFVTIDKQEKKIFFSGAARPMLIIQNGNIQLVKGSIRSTGGFQPANVKPFEDITFELSSPTYIYLFSDGYADQISIEKKKFGLQRFVDIIFQSYTKPMAAQRELLLQMIENHLHGTDQLDDICVMGLRVD